jgi:hypothetical protein
MATSHGKLTRITVATQNVSAFVKNSSLERGAKTHDVTGYGVDDEVYAGGLRGHKFSMSGVYDNTVSTGPRNVLNSQVGNALPIVRQVEGLGTGKPQDAFSAILEKYVETNPHDEMVTWSADFQVSGPVTSTNQP